MNTDDVLTRLEAWLTANAPALAAELTAGATDAELDALEQELGHSLPASYRAMHRRHEWWGQVFGFEHVPLNQVFGIWDGWRGAEDMNTEEDWGDAFRSVPPEAIKLLYTCPGWVPFLTDGGNNFIGLDFEPGSAGRAGQVITYGRDVEEKYVLAPDLDSFLAQYLGRLDAGRVWVGTLKNHPTPTWAIRLTDAAGYVPASYSWERLFPGFGAVPAVVPSGEPS